LQIRSHSYLRAVSEVSINRSLDSLDPAGLLASPKFRSRNESYMRAMSTISQVRAYLEVQTCSSEAMSSSGRLGPTHVRLLPNAEPQLRACHREGLLTGKGRGCRGTREDGLPASHRHHRSNHPEQHRSEETSIFHMLTHLLMTMH
ncbi:hypothetical protein XENOCAPTIV_029367, partial [Xenoophorus captivus]